MSDHDGASVAILSDLAASFELIGTQKKSQNDEQESNMPTPLLIFQTGLVLASSSSSTITHAAPEDRNVLRASFDGMIQSLPAHYVSSVLLGDLTRAFSSLAPTDGWTPEHRQALSSLEGIYTYSPTACRLGASVPLVTALATFYSHCSDDTDRTTMAQILSHLFIEGVIQRNLNQEDDEDAPLQLLMELVECLESRGGRDCLIHVQEWTRTNKNTCLEDAIRSKFSDNPQRDYAIRMLQSAVSATHETTAEEVVAPAEKKKKNNKKAAVVVSARQVLIEKVKGILPDLGEGYIETALACYGGDADRTINALMEGGPLHPRLRSLDPSLPLAVHRTSHEEEEAEEARRIQKARIQEMERHEEEMAFQLGRVMTSEPGLYNDDYDDQYDGSGEGGGGIGGADQGTMDVDYNAIRQYNKITRQVESEQLFWEEERNTNRQNGKGRNNKGKQPQQQEEMEDVEESESDTGGGKTYRGPDKGKGGRLLGPDGKYLPRGGKKQQPQPQQQQKVASKPASGGGGGTKKQTTDTSKTPKEGDDLTKIQKRRKNDNKSKIGNHHRKDRAQKKAMGGM